MYRTLFFIALLFGFAYTQQVQYCLESRLGANADTLDLYMQSTSNQTIDVAAVNLSVVFHDSCTEAPSILFDEFEQNWGNFALRTDTASNQNATYAGSTYDVRWQYANVDTNFLAPTFVVLPGDTGSRRLVMSLLFKGACSYDLYMEDVLENPVAQLGSAFFVPIPYTISRQPCDSCQALWTAEVDSASFTVSFSNFSITAPGPSQIIWDFGDGTQSDSLAPTHIYAGPGTYTVSLIIDGNGCSDTLTADIIIPAPACDVSFTTIRLDDLRYQFDGQTITDTAQWAWDFGDGNTSSEKSPVHQYASAGTGKYQVCVSTFNPLTGCRDTLCDSLEIVVTSILPIQKSTLSVAPNPAEDRVNVSFWNNDTGEQELTVMDVFGRIVKKKLVQSQPGENQISLSFTGLPKGVYWLQLTDGQSIKLMKN